MLIKKFLLPFHWTLSGVPAWWSFRRQTKEVIPPHQTGTPRNSMRIAFVIPWYGKGIAGGAEAECYGLVHGLRTYKPHIQVDVITTTLREFSADWNLPFYEEREHTEDGIRVFRFHPTKPSRHSFHVLNGERLMQGGTGSLKVPVTSPIARFQEHFYLRHMIQSPSMFRFLRNHYDDYDFFVYIPYMFGTTVLGSLITRQKSIVIPCLHDERYAFMRLYRKVLRSVRASLYHVPSELRLAQTICGQTLASPFLLGEQVDTNPPRGLAERFREQYSVHDPFVLFAGRKVAGKNLPLLVERFRSYKKTFPSALNLVLIGKGDLEYKTDFDIVDIGFVPESSKFDAMAASEALIQPSTNESFSIVMMESWLQKSPVIAFGECEVTKNHCEDSNGGLCFSDQESFNACLNTILHHKKKRQEMAENGYRYVIENYAPKIIMDRFEKILVAL